MSISTVYLAGPITGKSYDESVSWRKEVKDKLPYWFVTLSPMRGKEYLKDQSTIKNSYESTYMSNAKAVNTRDFNDVKRSDALLVNFTGATTVSIGTVMEIAWAKSFNIPVVCVMESNNIHNHIMLNDACGFIVGTLEEGIHTLVSLLASDARLEEYLRINPVKSTKGSDNDLNKNKITSEEWAKLLDALKQPIKINTPYKYPPYNPLDPLPIHNPPLSTPWDQPYYRGSIIF